MKPGFKTTEFWLTLIAQLLSLLVMAGVIPQADTGLLTDAAGKIAAGVVAAFTLCKYIHSRTLVKTSVWLLVLLLPGLANAQGVKPATGTDAIRHTCLFGNCGRGQDNSQIVALLTQIVQQNNRLIALLEQQQQQRQAPAPQFIVLGGPQQQIPLGGLPLQQIPLGGPPRQDIPLGGPPRQDIPLGNPPQQQIPIGTPPRQDIPLGNPPNQQMPRVPPTGPTGYQRFTIAQTCIWRPASGQMVR